MGSIIKTNPNARSWIKNAGRSFGLASLDLLSDTLPNSVASSLSTIEAIKQIKETAENLMANDEGTSRIMNSIDAAKTGFKNTIEDIKSGKIYNEDRAGDFGGFDDEFSLDDDFGFDDGDSFDDDGEPSPRAVIINKRDRYDVNNPLVKALEFSSESYVQSTRAITESSRINTAASITSFSKGFEDVTGGLYLINESINKIVDFNNSQMNSYIEDSARFYEKGMKIFDNMLEERERASRSQSTRESYNSDMFRDGLNMEAYTKHVGKQFNTYLDSTPLGMLLPFLENRDMVMSMASNPLAGFTKGIVRGVIGRNLLGSLNNFDTGIGALIPAIFNKIGSMKDSTNPILNFLGEVFGTNSKGKQFEDLSGYEKGKVDFDGYTKKSITTVIPTYLRKILAAITDRPEMGYDYKKGLFVDVAKAEKKLKEDLNQNITFAQYEAINNINKRVQDMEMSSEEEKRFREQVERFIFSVAQTESVPNLYKRVNKENKEVDDLAEIYSFDSDEDLERLRSILIDLKRENPHILGKMFGIDNLKARQELFDATDSSFGKDLEGNLDMIYAWKDNIKSKGLTGSLNSPISFLSDIKQILIDGIIVYPSTDNIPDSIKSRITIPEPNDTSDYDAPFGGLNLSAREKPEFAYRGMDSATVDIMKKLEEQYPTMDKNDLRKKAFQQAKLDDGDLTIFDKMGEFVVGKLPKSVQEWLRKPAGFVDSSLNKVTDFMYSLVFGDGENQPGIIDKVTNSLKIHFTNFKVFMETKVLTPIHDKLFGEEGLFTKIQQSSRWTEIKEYLFGAKGSDNKFSGGLFSNARNEFTKNLEWVKYQFTGVPPEGSNFDDKRETSILGEMKKGIGKFKDVIGEYILGKSYKSVDEEGNRVGFTKSILSQVQNGFQNFLDVFFGPKILNTEDGDFENKRYVDVNAMLAKMKERAPKGIADGILLGGVGSLAGMGLLGTLIGGPIGGATIGFGLGLLKQSDRFLNFMFGDKDEDGKRVGGVIGSKAIDFFTKNKTAIIGGAAVGAAKQMFLGSALPGMGLATALLGGPLAGAMLGAGIGLVTKSETFKDMMFGKEIDGKRVGGILSKFKNILPSSDSNLKGNTIAGALGGAGLATVIGKMGILGGFGLVGPLGGALIGAASGIALSSNKWRDLVFGKMDEKSGLRHGGWTEKLGNFAKEEVFTPFSHFMQRTSIRMMNLFEKSIKIPLMTAIAPITEGILSVGRGISRKITGFFSLLFNEEMRTIKDVAIKGIKTIVSAPFKMINIITKPFQNLLKWGFNKLGRGIEALTFGVLSMPVRLAGGAMNIGARLLGRKTKNENYKDQKQELALKQGDALFGRGEYQDSSIWDRIKGVVENRTFFTNKIQKENSLIYQNYLDKRKELLAEFKENRARRWDEYKAREASDNARREVMRKQGYTLSDDEFRERSKKLRGRSIEDLTLEQSMNIETTNKILSDTQTTLKDLIVNNSMRVIFGDKKRKDDDNDQTENTNDVLTKKPKRLLARVKDAVGDIAQGQNVKIPDENKTTVKNRGFFNIPLLSNITSKLPFGKTTKELKDEEEAKKDQKRGNIVFDAFNKLRDTLPHMKEHSQTWMKTIGKFALKAAGFGAALFVGIPLLFKLAQKLPDWIKAIPGKIFDIGKSIFTWVGETAIPWVTEKFFPNLLTWWKDDLWPWVTDQAFPWLTTALSNGFDAAVKGIENFVSEIPRWWKEDAIPWLQGTFIPKLGEGLYYAFYGSTNSNANREANEEYKILELEAKLKNTTDDIERENIKNQIVGIRSGMLVDSGKRLNESQEAYLERIAETERLKEEKLARLIYKHGDNGLTEEEIAASVAKTKKLREISGTIPEMTSESHYFDDNFSFDVNGRLKISTGGYNYRYATLDEIEKAYTDGKIGKSIYDQAISSSESATPRPFAIAQQEENDRIFLTKVSDVLKNIGNILTMGSNTVTSDVETNAGYFNPGMGGDDDEIDYKDKYLYDTGNILNKFGSGTNYLKYNEDSQARDFFTNHLNSMVSSEYGSRRNPTDPSKGYEWHTGIDFSTNKQTPQINSPISGTVIKNASSSDGFGNQLMIKDKAGLYHVFGHMKNKSPLTEGQAVSVGTRIGNVGSTGRSTGEHLHYEVRQNPQFGSDINPNLIDYKALNNGKYPEIGASNVGLLSDNPSGDLEVTGEEKTKEKKSFFTILANLFSKVNKAVMKRLGFGDVEGDELDPQSVIAKVDGKTVPVSVGTDPTATDYGYSVENVNTGADELTEYARNWRGPKYPAMANKQLDKYPVSDKDKNKLEKILSNVNTSVYKDNVDTIINTGKKHSVYPGYILAHAATESGWDAESTIAKKKGNLFGIEAYNNSPYASAKSFPLQLSGGLDFGVEWIRKNYFNKGQNTLYKMLDRPGHNYAVTDAGLPNYKWLDTISGIMNMGEGGLNLEDALKEAKQGIGTPESEVKRLRKETEEIDKPVSRSVRDIHSPMGMGGAEIISRSTTTIDTQLLKDMIEQLKLINKNTESTASETGKLNKKDWKVDISKGDTNNTVVNKTENNNNITPREAVYNKQKERQATNEYRRNRKIAVGRIS
ncbi:MAG: peptidoglycan DD-metalloendopeptidase family protein [Herbinix sp.]|nr:peptidoglycan DD-metalloendopeptidase family protein [Herbinix sp.]